MESTAGCSAKEQRMNPVKRSYYLPAKLIAAFHREAEKNGFVKEKVVAAAMLAFLESDPNGRAAMFDRLDRLLGGKAK
jgi:hypothetical protein